MEPEQTLIDRAVKVCGSRYRLSKLIDVSEPNLASMVAGRRGIPPRVAAKIAAVAGLDPRDALVIATIEKEKDPEEREALKRIFFLRGVGAMLAIGISVASLLPSPSLASVAAEPEARGRLYIMLTVARVFARRAWRRWVRRCDISQAAYAAPRHRPSALAMTLS